MKSLARRAVALTVAAAILAAQWPARAWASAAAADPNPAAEAMRFFRDLGVIENDADPLASYLGDDSQLTPIGRALYLSMKKRYNPAEEAESLKPVFERLRKNGPFNEARRSNVARALRIFTEKFGELNTAPANSVEESFRAGALREALMSGALIAEAPKANAYAQFAVKDGFQFRDRDGLAFEMTKNQVTTYNRELQKTQKFMNANRPAEVPRIPETGRYNYEMLQYSYWRLKTQETEYARAARVDRMIGLAELLGRQYPNDTWFDDASLEADLIRDAKAKTYDHRGRTYSVFDLVDAKFEQRRRYLDGASRAVARFEMDMKAFEAARTITDAQVATMSLDEQNALRWLSLTVLETQLFHVRNQRERVDPTSPDAQQVMKMIDESGLTADEKIRYKGQGVRMKERLDELARILADVRKKLHAADYAGSLDIVQAALGSTQKELGDLSTDYAIYLEVPSTAWLASGQTAGRNPFSRLARGVWKKMPWWGAKYADDMKAVEGSGKTPSLSKKYMELAALIASGNWSEARKRVIAMNPRAADYMMSGSPNAEAQKINDALRISASLKAAHDRISAVTETNKTLDAVSAYAAWTAGIALMAPPARGALNMVGKLSGPGIKMIQAGVGMGGIQGLAMRAIGRSFLVAGETARHTAARLASLEPSAAWVKKAGGEAAVGRYVAASGARALNAAARQASFTALAGTISAGFTVGTHLWDMASLRVAGVEIMRRGHSMFSEDFDGALKAAGAGFKGGAWWANESFHPALGYIGLPATAFGGTRLAGAMETIGSRGVLGSAGSGLKVMTNSKAALEAAAAEGGESVGFLGRLAEGKWYTGKPELAFGLSMTDNVAKYMLFSQAAGWLGEKYAWHAHTNVPIVLPFVGLVNSPEEDVERRIKSANSMGRAWLESPAWLLIPTYAAHAIADAAPIMRSREGALQYDKAGRTGDYLKKANGESVDFLKTPKPPVSQRIFEARFFAEPPALKWTMTEQIRRAGIRKELVRMLAGPDGKIEQVNPLEFYKMTKLADNKRFVNVYMNDEVRLVAHQDFVDALLSRPGQTSRALDAKPGSVVEGLGRITPEIQLDIAVALYTAEAMAGKKVPAELSQRVNALLAPYLEANRIVTPYAQALMEAITKAEPKAPRLDAALVEMKQAAQEWAGGKGDFAGKPYDALVTALRARAEHGVMTRLYDYVLAIEKRFNSFNTVETALGLNNVALDALRLEFSGRPEMMARLDAFSRDLRRWAAARKGLAVEGPRADGTYGELMAKFADDLKAAQGRLTADEAAALSKTIADMKSAPWVLHDSKGTPLMSWRPAQFVSFMESLAEIASGGRGGNPIRLFQKLTTAGGKTMMTFEGLLPLAEADAAARGMEVTFLTVQSNLEAQARMEFIAFRKIGSKLTFDTYEGFKTKIAEGKTKGRNVLKRYWILGDEMDGAALQPALTIGQTSGYVTRKNGVSTRLSEIDKALGRLIEHGRLERAANILTEARRLTTLFENLADVRARTPEAAAVRAEAGRLEAAAGNIQRRPAGPAAPAAESSVRESLGRLRRLLDALPPREGELLATARSSLSRADQALESRPSSALREAALAELRAGFMQQSRLLGLVETEGGGARLLQEARATRTALEARIERMESEPASAAGRLEEIELARLEIRLVERFEAASPSARLMKLDERIAAIKQGEGVDTTAAPRGEKLGRLRLEAGRIDASLPSDLRAAHETYRSQLSRVYDLGREMAKADMELAAAVGRGKISARERLQALESERATVRAALKSLELELGAVAPKSRREVKGEISRRFDLAASEIESIVGEGKPGWENAALRLLERRRALLDAFTADENPMYAVYREMKENAWSIAKNEALLSLEPARYNEAGRLLNRKINGDSLLKFLPKLLWRTMRGESMKIEEVGLTRLYALKMMKALSKDPLMPATQRDNLFWSFLHSLLFPKGIVHGENGSSWVRSEIVNLVSGYHDDPAGVRLDGRTGKFNVVHNGQWFESMDNATRRWWELEYGVDLTLPYSHQSLSTIKDVTTFKAARFISLSGTSGEKFEAHMRESGVRVSGKGSEMPGAVDMDVVAGSGMRLTRIREALASVAASSRERVALRPTDMTHAPAAVKIALDAHLAAQKLSARDSPVVEIAKVESPAAVAWLRELRAAQKDTGLVVLSVSDTRVLKVVLDYLKRGGLKPNEIAKVFSDTEYLRLNVPEAKVAGQMNLDALNTGEVKVLILDTRVGGRGLDLNFKGDRANPASDAFRGYTNMEMLVIDPQAMSQVHLLQAMGRIDKGRILPGTHREFSLVMDVRAVETEGLFRRMFAEDPFFVELKKDPSVSTFARERGIEKVTLPLIHDYVMSREADASGEGRLLAERYRKAVKTALEKRQAAVEMDQLISSSVLQERPAASGRHPGVELIR